MAQRAKHSKWYMRVMLGAWFILIVWPALYHAVNDSPGSYAIANLEYAVGSLLMAFGVGIHLFVWDDILGNDDLADEQMQSVSGESSVPDTAVSIPGIAAGGISDAVTPDAGSGQTPEAMPSDENGAELPLSMTIEQIDPDDDEWLYGNGAGNRGVFTSMCVVLGVLAVFLLTSLMAEFGIGVDLRFSYHVQIGPFEIDRDTVYWFLLLIVHPLWITYIVRKVGEDDCVTRDVISAVLQIVVLTITEFSLHMYNANVDLVRMALLHAVVLALAVRRYIWPEIQGRGGASTRRMAVLMVVLYVLLLAGLLAITAVSTGSLPEYMGISESSYETTMEIAHGIMTQARLIGRSDTLYEDADFMQILMNRGNPLQLICAGSGVLPGLLYLAVCSVFLAAAAGLLAENARHDGRDVMLWSAWSALLFRLIAGTLYSVGVPVPVSLPFTRYIDADSLCMMLILLSCQGDRFRVWLDTRFGDEDEDGALEEIDENISTNKIRI